VTPTDRLVCRFAAEPPQEPLPYGRWADRLRHEFLGACLRVEPDAGTELGEPAGDIVWYPDRTWDGRTYVPATARTTTGLELFGYVSFTPGGDGQEPDHFRASADYTDEIAEEHPEWKLDLNDEVLGGWRGEQGNVAAMTLVWGRPLVDQGASVTAELADLVVDQCALVESRFTLIAPDDYRGDTLDVKLFDGKGTELAAESLYE
jgi:hypothetical protein